MSGTKTHFLMAWLTYIVTRLKVASALRGKLLFVNYFLDLSVTYSFLYAQASKM